MPDPRPVVFVATRRADVPAGLSRYASVDGSVPGATWTWDHHVTGEPINLDAMPQRLALDGLDGVGTTHADTDAIASAAVLLLGGEARVEPALARVLRAASFRCDHLRPDPAATPEEDRLGHGLHAALSRRLLAGPGAFGPLVHALVAAARAGGPLPWEDPAPPRADAAVDERGPVAVFDRRGLPPAPPEALYAHTRCPIGLFVDDHPAGGRRFTVGVNPGRPDAPDDLGPALRALAALEFAHGPPCLGPEPVPGAENWGGRRTVFGSPWNHGSRLSVDEVVAAVRAALFPAG